MRWGGLHGQCAGGGDLHGRCGDCACPGGSSGVAETRPFRHGRAHPIWFRRPHRRPTPEPRRPRPFDLRRCPRRPDSVRPKHPEAYHAALPLLTRLPPSQMLCLPATVGCEGGAAGHLCYAVGAESRRLAVGFIGARGRPLPTRSCARVHSPGVRRPAGRGSASGCSNRSLANPSGVLEGRSWRLFRGAARGRWDGEGRSGMNWLGRLALLA